MNPSTGQRVKCILRNNIVLEGIVESWSDQKSVLRSLDEQSVSIIQRTLEDVVVVKIILVLPDQNIPANPSREEIAQKLKETIELPSDGELRVKNIAQLKNMVNQQEKEIIISKLKDHHVGEVRKMKYGYPGLFKKPSAE